MPKRRRGSEDGPFIQSGDKRISLAGYLTPKVKQESQDDVPAPKEIPPEAVAAVKKKSHQSNPRMERGNKDLLKVREKLPIWEHRDEIRGALRANDVLLVAAETGSGKSTQVPQFLFTEDWFRKKTVTVRKQDRTERVSVGGVIAITQPRRVAAMTLAQRVSREAGTPLRLGPGQQEGLVGYSVRFDRNVPKGTKIKFMTEGMLLQELLHDPHLRQYSAVLVDEIHERSVDVDLLSGFLKQILSGDKAGRGGVPLKVAIMSATANVDKIRSFFTVEKDGQTHEPVVINIPGRLYPVDIIYTPAPVTDLQDAIIKTISKIHKEEPCPGDILVFLTGQHDIEIARNNLEDYAKTLPSTSPRLVPIPLFGQMSMEAQQQAFQPAKGRIARKVILATNIAETSVTVPGVRYVVDTGKVKEKQYRVRLGMETLLAKAISKSSAIQRAGRAGREAAGKCYRLYTEEVYDTLLKDTGKPEIVRIDVLGAVLTMKARGIDDIFNFPLMDTPDVESFNKALIHLHVLKAITDEQQLTEMGQRMAVFPLSAQYGRVLLAAADPENDCVLEVIDIISCLTAGEDIFHQIRLEEEAEEVQERRKALYRREGDLLTYLTTMQQYTEEHADRMAWCKARKVDVRVMKVALNIRRQLRGLCLQEQMLTEAAPADPQPFTPVSPEGAETILKCFLAGFAMKTAFLAPDQSYTTSIGKHVVAIHPSSVLHGQKKEAIMFMEHVYTTKNYARKVSVVQANWVLDVFEFDGDDA